MDKRLYEVIRSVLSPDLLLPDKTFLYIPPVSDFKGYCYIASEAYWHLTGKTLRPMQAPSPYGSHWWLETKTHERIDLTHEQFKPSQLAAIYAAGVGRNFLTSKPSRRAQEVIRRAERWL